ncbi:HlyD family efflux transporter periplasmic adaptor subunit [Marinicella sp. S1101]|uniref:HlyD family secretion protein n=1 Tax=Marinicella marina TaxID=2996016 RepID=UPI002260A335|nr:HlyD family efflux transporter periplasmic adaptor subunit [Marinicella marina]MCX7553310.1 HlyD family efflux transporter periplasmic adaptor subunit [Marinicella marina]MDJ1139042.1 HlyD family efflux transporter periplasmic adaptor subunit [Marinicella marina]
MKKSLILTLMFVTALSHADMYTGTVESSQTQVINMPQVRGWQAKIAEMIDEGSFVEAGDFLVRIDGSEVDSTIESKVEQLDVFKASAKRDMIQIEIDLNNANLAFERAKVTRKVAQLKADVPVNFIGELEFKERQLALKKSIKDLNDAENELNTIIKNKREKELEIELGLQQKQQELTYWQGQLAALSITADQSGYVIYAAHPRTGSKYQVGDQANSGMEILRVSKKQNMKVKAWVNAIDVPKITQGKAVKVSFDALPNAQVNGEITSISSGGRDKNDWGDGLYYEVEVSLNGADDIELLPGMSALVKLSEV